MAQNDRCGHCWMRITGKRSYLNGEVFHYHCYMYRAHGVTIPAEVDQESVSEDNPWGGTVDHYDASVENEMLFCV